VYIAIGGGAIVVMAVVVTLIAMMQGGRGDTLKHDAAQDASNRNQNVSEDIAAKLVKSEQERKAADEKAAAAEKALEERKAADEKAAVAEKALLERKAADAKVAAAEKALAEQKAADARLAEKRSAQSDPAASYKAFCQNFVRAIDQEKEVTSILDGKRHKGYFRMASQEYSVDLQHTNSLISPFVGSLQISASFFANGKKVAVWPVRFTFAMQDGKWTLSEAEDYSSSLEKWYSLLETPWIRQFVANAVAHAQSP
jgi:flagellar biosynthesis GTPase FlhF